VAFSTFFVIFFAGVVCAYIDCKGTIVVPATMTAKVRRGITLFVFEFSWSEKCLLIIEKKVYKQYIYEFPYNIKLNALVI
jgi:DNA-binding transcriptional regulator/RsmH inhibitor MraZ